ncbi:tetratricopeptide repeat protein [Prosthecobacter dejongeii]|uniref:Tfp pilus assembly protein PilF/ribonuclease BN (tRNA processing enzyme) n=1 Tax=Prosthecobacter dejongeii TaxID=48465 RepID=A0A7W7YHP9_9BACT|nr:tetratricopeptide repeat protein [Prosthecobacter dejongeii]MBB5036415.1 Tfp pilus assembly protein PilF/ribonuclease BN (tRNA processing enzyme) [Prosthecobacter dejongeii]
MQPSRRKIASKRSKDDQESEFSRLFWAVWEQQPLLGDKASTSDSSSETAMAFADAQSWEWAKALIKASKLSRTSEFDKALKLIAETEHSVPERWQGLLHFVRGAAFEEEGHHEEAIKAYRKALDDPKLSQPGNVWNSFGNKLADKGALDEAIKAYRRALDDPSFDTPGYAWNNLGIVLGDKGEQDEAIKAYRTALDYPNYDTPGYAWNNIGNALWAKGEHDEAIKAYRRALDYPNYDTPGYTWNNIGNALGDKGEHDEAIKAYRKALEDPNLQTRAKAWTNLAQTYVDLGKLEEAEGAYQKALASKDTQGGDHARARRGLQILRSKIVPTALSPDDRAMMARPAKGGDTAEIEEGIIAAIDEAGDTQYERYLKKGDSERDNTLSILRGWSSAVTLLEGSERRWRGGGYFLKWRGYGIVIDPGFDFLRNFHDAGYHGREIAAVVVSHNHPDHNSDLKHIDDLRYELYKRLASTKGPGSKPYVLLWDEDTSTATKFGFDKPQHQHPPIVMGSGFPQPFHLGKHPAKIPVRITPFKVNHGTDVQHALGMMVELLDNKGKTVLRIGYTADTAYFADLQQHLSKCDVLIAHISQPTIEELRDPSKLKDVHLGYRGTARLLKECQPNLALIGEFWAGFTDLRIPLVKGLRQLSGVKDVLPAGLAMHLRLPSLDIECTECRKLTPYSEIKVAPPTDKFGSLAYLCQSCTLG